MVRLNWIEDSEWGRNEELDIRSVKANGKKKKTVEQ